MTKTISQKLRELARKPDTANWNKSHWESGVIACNWRSVRTENLDDLSPDEWFLFCNLVACALESEQ
jgi:hypothetical protein